MSSYQNNSGSCVGPTKVGVKAQLTQFQLACSVGTRVTIVRNLVPDEVAPGFNYNLDKKGASAQHQMMVGVAGQRQRWASYVDPTLDHLMSCGDERLIKNGMIRQK